MNVFYGRGDELAKLMQIFNNLQSPYIVNINAPSGIGKTRLIQEFYNVLAKKSSYWDEVHNHDYFKDVEIKPEIRLNHGELDFLFLTTRALEKKGSLANYDFCFDRIRHQLSLHISSIISLLRSRQQNKKIAKSTFSLLMNFVLPGSSELINLLNLVKDCIAGSIDTVELIDDIYNRYNKKDQNDKEGYNNEVNNILNKTISVLEELYKSENKIKMIIVIDDIHWIDNFTTYILIKLLETAHNEHWPILFILSGWSEALTKGNADYNKDFVALTEYINKLPYYSEIILKPVAEKSLYNIIRDRIKNLDLKSCKLLIKRCNGDIDFLNDLLDEIIETPGWLTDDQKLNVEISELKTLPSKAVEMARNRLRSYPLEIKNILYWCSLQGMNFSELFIKKLLSSNDVNVNEVAKLLIKTDTEYGLTFLQDDTLMFHYGEFRRAATYEACLSFMNRNPKILQFKRSLLSIYIDFYRSGDWLNLQSDKKNRYIFLVDDLCKSLNIKDGNILFVRDTLIIYLIKSKLIIGDYNLVINLSKELIDRSADVFLIDKCYSMLVDAYYFSGDKDKEKECFVLWAEIKNKNKYNYNIKLARFMRRTSDTTHSFEALNKALVFARNSEEELEVELELLKSLWAHGEVYTAYNRLKSIETKFRDELNKTNIYLLYATSAYLILHDLDKCRQASIFASKCIQQYLIEGDIQQTNIYTVNLADSLWGLGYKENAIERLKNNIEIARKQNLPQLLDISLICLANIYSEQNETNFAETLYEEGIQLAQEIGHDWDFLYGNIYYNLYKINRGKFEQVTNIQVGDEYYYLKELNTLVQIYFKFVKGMNITTDYNFQIPVAKLNYYAMLYRQTPNKLNSYRFAEVLAQMEGAKFNRGFIFSTIKIILSSGLIDELIFGQINDWFHTYNCDIENQKQIKIARCNYKICEARCCYDGVYLQPDEVDVITNVVNSNPDYFSFLPKDYIIKSKWNDVEGYKTATKPYSYKRLDFPKHFNQTRCVFALNDGACSLQKYAMDKNLDFFTFKPLACQLFPLEGNKGNILPPSLNYKLDKYFLGVNYPGYTNYTPCGINRTDGEDWIDVLKKEISIYNNYIQNRDKS